MIKRSKSVAIALICITFFAIKAYYFGKDSAERERRVIIKQKNK